MVQKIVNHALMDAGVCPQRGRVRERERSRGQILVIFALSAFVFVGMCAVVVDVAWYWANTLRVQRAADAAALAGAVLLPDKLTDAYLRAKNEATKNGYTTGGGVSVTPIQDSLAVTGGNPNQMDVTITAPVNTFFMRAFGITSINATRSSKGEYVLPVPMGSPQNYFGVGDFLLTPITTRSPTAVVSGGQWTTPANADGVVDTQYAVAVADNDAQQWNTFNLTTGSDGVAAGATIGRIEVRLRAKLTGSGNNTTNCRLLAALSWNGGASWTNATVATPALTATETLYSLPDPASDWGSHTWVQGDFTNTNFRARLTWNEANCSSSRTASVNTLEVAVAAEKDAPVYDPTAPANALTPQNFWGAIFTKGGVRQNGDYFAPATIGGSASGTYSPTTGASPTYDAHGYDYTVDFTGSSNGQVQLFDPIFCATGPNTTSGWYGAGDHWTTLGSSGNTVVAPVAVTYTLWDTKNTAYDLTDDALIATLAYDPSSKTLGDFGGTVGSPTSVQNYGDSDAIDCSTNPAHNHWVPLGPTNLGSGVYRINVETSSQAANANVGAENLFAIWVQASGGKARVYGGGRMAGYTQVGAAPQSFFLAQIDKRYAGRTLQIQLFDPGDVSGDATLQIQSPDTGAYHFVTFDWTADKGCKAGVSEPSCSGNGKTAIQTASGGKSSFDNSMIVITIQLPSTYGTVSLEPSGVPGATAADRSGWWKIYYNVTNANDTTTWQTRIVGNPVHLIVP